MRSGYTRLAVGLCAAAAMDVVAGAQTSQQPTPPAQAAPRCRISGRVTSGNVPLPGVSVVVHAGDALRAATSTDLDGTYAILFTPNATYHLSADFAGFAGAERDLTLAAPPCDQTVDFRLALLSRTAPINPLPTTQTAQASTSTAQASPAQTGAASVPETNPQAAPPVDGSRRGRGAGGQTAGGGGRGAQPGSRFQTLSVQSAANDAAVDAAQATDSEDVTKLLPPGFSLQNAQADAIAINGSSDATSLDRGPMNDRARLINLGQLDPATGQLAQGFGPQGGGPPGPGGFGGGPGGPGGPGGRGGGPGGSRGGFFLAGRAAQAQRPYQGSTTYTFGGSVLDTPPYQLNPNVPASQPQFAQNTFGGTFGGPLKIPGIYADEKRRTTFQVNYTGNESNNVFDQYATVPTAAERNGDFSAVPTPLMNPKTGQPFPGNQIPASAISPSAAALLQYIPAPTLPGTTQNYHVSEPTHTSSEAISLRLIQNLSQTVPQGPNGPGGRGGFGGFGGGGGRGGGGGGRGGGPGRGTSVVLTAQMQYRRNETQALSVFPGLGSDTTSTSLSAPISLNVRRGRSIHNFTVNLTHSTTETGNGFENSVNVGGLAGIQYPGGAPTNPLNWGVPNLTFSSGLTGVSMAPASGRTDNRLTTSYVWIHPSPKQQLRIGGDYRLDRSEAEINANARGNFIFTGLYSGSDFADFLLGFPQEATLQAGGTNRLRQNSVDGYIEDNWQRSAKLTLNLGLRYELWMPYTGQMANLDAAPNFTAVAPVCTSIPGNATTSCLPGSVGPYSGAFPAGLVNADYHNVGPRLGFAYRMNPKTILRGGYSITYNSGSLASIATELSAQPPFADTETITGSALTPLTLATALQTTPTTETTNNWGVDRNYALGMIQTWNTTLLRNLTQNWFLQAGYTGIKGSDLDVLSAPDLGPGGALIPGAQAFIWESSGAHSIMNGGNLQLGKRLANGYSGNFSYTLARAMDDASSLGAGGPVVAQNPNNLAGEWAPSNFDRRQQVSGNVYVELPFGPNRRWLKNGGFLAAMLGEWSAQFTLTLQSGTPLTAHVLGATTDLNGGVNGSLRANYNGGPIPLPDPTVSEYFYTTAFSEPAPGQFGDSSRNMIVGPGTRQLNGLFQRDIRLGSTRSMTLQVNANNLLDTVQWATVNTNVNAGPLFGQVLSARPMRTITVTARFRF